MYIDIHIGIGICKGIGISTSVGTYVRICIFLFTVGGLVTGRWKLCSWATPNNFAPLK